MGGESAARNLTVKNPTNLKVKRWVVLHADWNGESARGDAANIRGKIFKTNPQGGWVMKGSVAACVIRIAYLNICLGQAEGFEAAI